MNTPRARKSCFSGRNAFTLVEIALALGVAAFALVAIIGMIPLALDNARESRLQTRATLIGRSLFDDLLSGTDGNLLVLKRNAGEDSDFEIISLQDGMSKSFTMTFDANGSQLASAGHFAPGEDMPHDALFVANMRITKSALAPAMVEVSIETPASAVEANRKKYQFVSRIFR